MATSLSWNSNTDGTTSPRSKGSTGATSNSARVTGLSEDRTMPIAVVGMSFRGPADATSVESLWKMISEGREGWSRIPKEKWNNDAFYHPDHSRHGTINVEGGHFFAEDLARFDAPFFNMTNVEAAALDPQQRLLLEGTFEAVENAGIPLEKIMGTKTSCFVGSFGGDYTDMLLRDPDSIPMYQCTNAGQSRAITANRLSYFFDLKGPSVTVDTACSGSLVAFHLACQSIRTGDAKMALASGVNTILSHEFMSTMSMMRFLSPDGRCYTFDERANGYARGEGVGCILLKPLADALEDNDTIRAVIRGTGSNQDGKTSGITLPSAIAQETLVRDVYDAAGLDPLETDYVEAHGTGTQAGDPLETGALSKVFGPDRSFDQPLRIGSIKTNTGHLEGASGIAGVIKAILMLENRFFLPNRNFKTINPRIPLHDWKLKVQLNNEKWDTAGPHRASVNSFGYGGSNAHAILEDAQGYLSSRDLRGSFRKIKALPPLLQQLPANGHTNGCAIGEDYTKESKCTQIFVLSSFDEASGKKQAERMHAYLQEKTARIDDQFMDDLAYTLNERRSKFTWKTAIPASSATNLMEALKSNVKFSRALRKPTLGFVFTGQGAQWCGMGQELLAAYPVFEESISRIGAYLTSLGAPFNVKDEIMGDPKSSQISLALYSQPICSAVQIALVDLLSSWGIKPASVTGHSSGEIAAAYTAGALSMEDAMSVAYYRGVASSNMQKGGKAQGAMMAVGLSKEEAVPYLAALTTGRVVIACVNSPSSITISGDLLAINELQAILEEKSLFARKLAVEVAYHSHHMELVATQYLDAISNVQVRTRKQEDDDDGEVEFFSAVTGAKAALSELGAAYWVSNLLGQVKFADSVRHLCLETSDARSRSKRKARKRTGAATKVNIDMLIEIGPHSALVGPIQQILKADPTLNNATIAYSSALVRKSSAIDTALNLASILLTAGYPINLPIINRPRGRNDHVQALVDLPSYAWNHSSSYWAEPRLSKVYRNRTHPRTDLLGALDRNSSPLEPRWRNHLRATEIPWIKDHKIQSNIVYPAAGYVVMAIEAIVQQALEKPTLSKVTGYMLREITIGAALIVDEQSDSEIILSMRPYTDSVRTRSRTWDEFAIFSVTEDSRWTEHCRGLIRVQTSDESINPIAGDVETHAEREKTKNDITEAERNCHKEVDTKEFYEHLASIGLEYGNTFANMTKARSGRDLCIAEIAISDTAAVMPMNFQYPFVVHPSTLDSMFHPMFVAVSAEDLLRNPAVPMFIDELFVSHGITNQPGHKFKVCVSTEKKDQSHIVASISVVDRDNNDSSDQQSHDLTLSVKGLTCKVLARDVAENSSEEMQRIAYKIEWNADADLLSVEVADRLCAVDKTDANDLKSKKLLEEAAFYYIKRAFTLISRNEVATMKPHYQKLWYSLSSFVKSFRDREFEAPIASITSCSDLTLNQFIQKVRSSGPEGQLLCVVGEQLPRILRNEVDPSSVIAAEDRLNNYWNVAPRFLSSYQAGARYLEILGHKNPHLSILEVGARSGGAALSIIQALTSADGSTARFKSYTYTDTDRTFFDAVAEKFEPWAGLIKYKELDVESDPLAQGYEAGSYDVVIIAARGLQMIKSRCKTLSNIHTLLKPGGRLLLVDTVQEHIASLLIFGTLETWCFNKEDERSLSSQEWQNTLLENHFSGLNVVIKNSITETGYQTSMMVSRAVEEPSSIISDVLIVAEAEDCGVSLSHLQGLLKDLQISVEVTTFAKAKTAGRPCIVLSELTMSILGKPDEATFETIKELFVKSDGGVLWVVRGATVPSLNPNGSLATGISRTARSETGATKIVTLDLDGQNQLSDRRTAETIFVLFKNHFVSGKFSDDLDFEYAERSGILVIPRIVENTELNKALLSSMQETVAVDQPFYQPGRPLRINVGTLGRLDNLYFVNDESVLGLPEDHIQIQVKATGLEFKDVQIALGQAKVESPLGTECSGIISAIGKSVRSFTIGDRVACFGSGTISNFYSDKASAFQQIPDDMTFEVAAALPVAYCTAYYSAYTLARVCPGDKVLIHEASDTRGQAIFELCKLIGAEVFATVKTLEQKTLVQQLGIPEHQILYNHNDSFAKAIMRMTGGNGVDVMFNSFAGEALRWTWNCIAPHGRFIEFGGHESGIHARLDMGNFAKNTLFTAFDLTYLIAQRREVAHKVWSEVMALIRGKVLKGPSKVRVYPISDLEKALQDIQSRASVGKVVVAFKPEDIVKVIPYDNSKGLLRADASYLLVGGLGGIGRATALWLMEHGARNLIFANRSGLSRQESRDVVNALETKGAKVAVYSCDISKPYQVQNLVVQASQTMPPIRGVIQAAMVLRDTLLEKMSVDDYNAVLQPKFQGTWNLHNLLPKNMDFFLMLSSISGVIGNATQAAYAAGSTFMDAFSAYRNSLGLPAVTLDLGVITEIGYLAANKELSKGMERQGFEGTNEKTLMALIESAIVNPRREGALAQTITGLGSWKDGVSLSNFDAPLFAQFRRQALSSGDNGGEVSTVDSVRQDLRQSKTMDDAAAKVCTALIGKLATRLSTPVDNINSSKTVSDYGVDSLVAVELRNWIVKEMESTMPILELLANHSLLQLSTKIAQRSKLVSVAGDD